MGDPFDTRRVARYGRAEEVAPGVRRITCRNPSPMTFTGTQSYIVGSGRVAVIDPGPDDPEHLAAIRDALAPSEEIAAILITHTHRDHSPGASALAAATGAELFAFGVHGSGMRPEMRALAEAGVELGGGEGADHAFRPDRTLAEGETVAGPDWTLAALRTPGHLSNHLAFALEGTGVVFTGDAVMGWATTMVSPPEGDMTDQMATLRRLALRGDDRLYLPGHGHGVDRPHRLIAHLLHHRQAREAAVLDALRTRGAADAATLAADVYRDTDPRLLPAAARNVLAMLIGLQSEGRVACEGVPGPAAFFRPD